ncbi:MAG TPA: ATP synthase F1 subunit delta [Gemmataceae bacterium]|jgi:F-type H+-transporting ATPase subunit delta|nr:ATP synthase F1 subunit delta [Gemmataceae bacterium]
MNQNQEQDLFSSTADVGEQRVARVYAEALLNAAQKHNQADEVLEELASLVGDVFRADPQLEAFFSSGAIGRDRKAGVIRSVFDNRASELLVNFLLVLNDHERLNLLRPMLAAARELRDQRARRVRVEVQTAVPMAEDQRERLRRQLHDALHLEPLLDARVDPDLLGGLVVRVGDWLYDGSVRARLKSIRDQLIARSSHEIQSRRDRFRSANGD